MSPRPQVDHIRRPQILSAAAEVIAERGVASTRIADVAEDGFRTLWMELWTRALRDRAELPPLEPAEAVDELAAAQ